MTSLRPLNGTFQLRCSGTGGVDVQSGYTAPTGTRVMIRVYSPATDQTPLAIVATESSARGWVPVLREQQAGRG